MRVELGLARGAKGQDDRRLRILKRASTAASSKFTIGGRLKERGGAKPVSLAQIKIKDVGDAP